MLNNSFTEIKKKSLGCFKNIWNCLCLIINPEMYSKCYCMKSLQTTHVAFPVSLRASYFIFDIFFYYSDFLVEVFSFTRNDFKYKLMTAQRRVCDVKAL